MHGDQRGLQGSLIWGFGGVVAFVGFGADSFFGEEFDGRAEEVLKESIFVAVQVIEERDDLGVIQSFVSEPLTDVGPVFLFDVGVVFAVVGAAAGELDGLFFLGEVAVEVVVEEFASVVGVEAEEGERERLFDVVDLFEDGGFAFAPDGSLFGPGGGDIDGIEGYKRTCRRGIGRSGRWCRLRESRGGIHPIGWFGWGFGF